MEKLFGAGNSNKNIQEWKANSLVFCAIFQIICETQDPCALQYYGKMMALGVGPP